MLIPVALERLNHGLLNLVFFKSIQNPTIKTVAAMYDMVATAQLVTFRNIDHGRRRGNVTVKLRRFAASSTCIAIYSNSYRPGPKRGKPDMFFSFFLIV